MSLADEEFKTAREERASRITIEELADEDGGDTTRRRRRQKAFARHEPQLRTYLSDVYHRAAEKAAERPYAAGAITALSLPFIGLVVRQQTKRPSLSHPFSLDRHICSHLFLPPPIDSSVRTRGRGAAHGEALS